MASKRQTSNNKTSLKGLLKQLKGSDRVDVSALPLDFDAEAYLALNPDVAESGFNPYWHYVVQGQREQRPYSRDHIPPGRRSSQALPDDFDPEEYRRLNPDLAGYEGNLQEHFLRHGIQELRRYRTGRPPVLPALDKYERIPDDFDPDIYLTLNPDTAGSPLNPYEHFASHGSIEKRQYKLTTPAACHGREFDPGKPTILLVSHEATRTGAPILTWNICKHLATTHNTVVLLLAPGPLLTNFQVDAHATYLIPEAKHNPTFARHVVDALRQRHPFGYAILNSIETGALCEPLTVAGVPNLLLIHEFAANTMPRDKFAHARAWASLTVFSTELTKADAANCFPGLFDHAKVMPQGRCIVPPSLRTSPDAAFASDIGPKSAPDIAQSTRKLVIGLGSVCIRKGVDLFIEVAARIEKLSGQQAWEFLWVGGGYPDYDPEYSAILKDQMSRAGLGDRIHIVAETDDLDSLYAKADLLLLSSRLDPLPNVAIDAICEGLPVVCFDKASGIADVLKVHALQEQCVADYLDSTDMAQKAVRLLDDHIGHTVRQALRRIGASAFSMSRYCDTLLGLQEEATSRWRAPSATVDELINGRCFDAPYYLGRPLAPYQPQLTERTLCWDYVLKTSLSTVVRKPVPGFNPLAYAERLALPAGMDPLLHHMKQSTHQATPLITPASCEPSDRSTQQSRIALHLHAFYPDLLPDILQRLLANQCVVDVFVTVDSEIKSAEVKSILHSFDMQHTRVECVPNVGRDIYPFLDLCNSIIDQYDVIGHLHTKKSPHVTDGSDLVMRWRELLLGNLLGSDCGPRMLDRIIGHMDKHPEVQIVFPDDPHVMGWGKNEAMARQLVSEDEFSELPRQFDFPVGTMFWSRAAYLRSFLEMNLPKRFTPAEPLPIDGTVLHAWERLLGAEAAIGQPVRYALTFVPGLTR